ncbi:hypothetical protein Emed_000199 [Eimeria media]
MPARLSLRLLLPAAAAAATLSALLPSAAAAGAFPESVVSEGFLPPAAEEQAAEEKSFSIADSRTSSAAVVPAEEAPLPLPSDTTASAAATAGEEAELEQLGEKEVQEPVPPPEVDLARRFVASADQLMSKMYALAKSHTSKQPKGTRTALLGAAGMLIFFLLHSIAQYAKGASVGQDVLFHSSTGRTTASGVGMIVSATLLIAGALEALIAYNAPKNGALAANVFPARGRKQAAIGRMMLIVTAVAITIGWVLGFPNFFMEAATLGFLSGSTLVVLGFTLLLREFQKGVNMMRQLYAPHAKDLKALSEDAQIDASLLLQLADHFLTKGLPEPVPVEQLEGAADGDQQQTDGLPADAAFQSPAELLNALVGQLDMEGNGGENPLAGALANAFRELENNPKLLEQMSGLEQDLLKALQKGGLPSPAAAAEAAAEAETAAPVSPEEDAAEPLDAEADE